MSITRFLLFDGLGSLIYGTFYIAAGFLFHDQLGKVISWLSRLGFGAVLLGLVLISGYLALKYFQRRKPAGLTALAPSPLLEERAGERRPVPSAVTVAAGLRPAVEPGILPGGPGEGQYQLAQPILME
jgi:hypothetical protein